MIKLFLFILFLATYASSLNNPQSFGLQTTQSEPLELLKLETKAVTQGPYVEIQYTFLYKNPFNETIQTQFVFPQIENAVFHKFKATLQNQTFIAKIVKNPANTTHDSDPSSTSSIHLAPQETVEIIFSMIQPLEVALNKFYELTLPAFINKTTSSSPSSSSLQQWNIEIELKSSDPFVVLSNPTHRLLPELSEQNLSTTSSKIYQAFWNVTVTSDRDFRVYFGPKNLAKPHITLATHPQDPHNHVMLLNIIPNLGHVSAQQAQDMLENTTIDGLFEMRKKASAFKLAFGDLCVFMIDRSDSMKGLKFESLKKKLELLLTDYSLHCDTIDIISFGSTFEVFSETNRIYRESDIIKWVHTIEADMGGSDLLKALKYVSSRKYELWTQFCNGDCVEIILLTDGDISYPNKAMEYMDHVSLIVGIGEDASNGRIERLAQANGKQRKLALEEDNLEDKIREWIEPYKTDYLIGNFEVSYSIQCRDNKNQLVYKYEPDDDVDMQFFTEWFYLSNVTNYKSCHARILGIKDDLSNEFQEEITISDFSIAEITEIWHKVASHAQIKKLEWEQTRSDKYWGRSAEFLEEIRNKINKRIRNLSLKYQILSPFTSLVLQTESDHVKASPSLSSEFFDLSRFNKPIPPEPVTVPQTNFVFPENYIPLDSIQYAKKQRNTTVASKKAEHIEL